MLFSSQMHHSFDLSEMEPHPDKILMDKILIMI